jgi:hypothetical protein
MGALGWGRLYLRRPQNQEVVERSICKTTDLAPVVLFGALQNLQENYAVLQVAIGRIDHSAPRNT